MKLNLIAFSGQVGIHSPQEVQSLGAQDALLLLPLALAALGMLASLLTLPIVRLCFKRSPVFALSLGLVAAALLYALASLLLVEWHLGINPRMHEQRRLR